MGFFDTFFCRKVCRQEKGCEGFLSASDVVRSSEVSVLRVSMEALVRTRRRQQLHSGMLHCQFGLGRLNFLAEVNYGFNKYMSSGAYSDLVTPFENFLSVMFIINSVVFCCCGL